MEIGTNVLLELNHGPRERGFGPSKTEGVTEYGTKNIYAGVPVIIGSEGVEKIIELELSSEEKENFEKSVKTVRDLYDSAKKIDSSL